MAKDSPSEQDRQTAAKIRAWMKAVLKEKDWTPPQWAKGAKIAPSTVQRPLKEGYEFVTSTKTLRKLAEAAGVPLPAFGEGQRLPAGQIELPVRYEVAAGAFRRPDELSQIPLGWAEVDVIKPYRDFAQWLELVVGDSMNALYPPGTVLHVVDAIELGYTATHDDAVVVQRSRADGSFIERTVKQVALTPNGVELWPRSYSAAWNAPISLTNGAVHGEDLEVRIVGLVLRGYIGLPITKSRLTEAA